MLEWARSRPVRCLKIGTDAVAWAETERSWRGRATHRCLLTPVPEGSVKPSPVEPNLSDLPALEARIRTLTGSRPELRIGRHFVANIPRPIVLLLPDAAVRAVVLPFDHLPSKSDERDALIRWRLGQEQLFPLNGAKVVSQVFLDSMQGGGPVHTVLAVAIQEAVLVQYESLCQSLGLLPQAVGMTSLQLFAFWVRASGKSRWLRRDFLWANVTDNALTTMVFHGGRLLFYRCKLLGAATVALGERLEKIVEECGASLEACHQRYPTAVIKEAVLCADDNLSALQRKVEAGLDLSVEQVGWRAVEALGRVTKDSHPSMPSLAALAGAS
jgi:hypothetical protein